MHVEFSLSGWRASLGGRCKELRGLDVTPRRWRQACGIDRDLALAACGDFCGPPNAEGAVLSGRAAARAMAGALQGTGSS